MASAQANALTDLNTEGCCGKCLFAALDDVFYLVSFFKMLDLFIVWFFMLILVADCSFLDDGCFVFEWGAAVNFNLFL